MSLTFSVNVDGKEIVFAYDEVARALSVTSIDGIARHIICASGHIKSFDDAENYAKVLANEFKANPFWHPV
ncbi:MAG: hypothetical protein ACO3FP_08305 [Burkholderiales bacterium]